LWGKGFRGSETWEVWLVKQRLTSLGVLDAADGIPMIQTAVMGVEELVVRVQLFIAATTTVRRTRPPVAVDSEHTK